MHGALNYRVIAIFCPEYKKLLRNMKLQCLKLFIMTKTKRNEFLEDFREISLVGSLNWSISFRNMNFKLILIRRFQNVPHALGFEVKQSKIFCRSFRTCIILLSADFTINKLFWP